MITFTITTRDSAIYVPLMANHETRFKVQGEDTVFPHEVITIMSGYLKEASEDVIVIPIQSTAEVSYVCVIITTPGLWRFYERAYRFIYSADGDDGEYESTIEFGPEYVTDYPR
jgi:hypothetical protein